MTEWNTSENEQQPLGRRLAAYRRTFGLTQEALAAKTGYSRSTIANVETGRQKGPRSFWQRCDDALGPDADLLRTYDDAGHPHREARHPQPKAARTASQTRIRTLAIRPPDPSTRLLDTIREVDDRRQLTMRSNTDEAKMAHLEAATLRAIAANEREAPAVLAPRVRQLRHHVHELLQGHQHPAQRKRLYTVALYQSGLLGALAVDLRRWQTASAYGQEAYELSTCLDSSELHAWARATQSLIEYYAGNHHDALAYARDGQRLDIHRRHTVRLTLNGEARALAKLGDHEGVEEAVTRGLTHLDKQPTATDIGASLSTDSYHRLRAHANAATAYLDVGQPHRVRAYVEPALAAFDSARLPRPQALSRLDLATALLQCMKDTRTVELDHACELATEALDITREAHRESVYQRAEGFLRAASAWADDPAVRRVTGLVTAYRKGQLSIECPGVTP